MGQYDGQAANAFVKGMQSGYGFVDKAVTSSQDRDNKQRAADQLATQKESQIRATQEIENDIYSQGDTAINEKTKEQIAAQDTALKQENKNKMNSVLANYIASDTPEDSTSSIEDSKTVFKNNSALAKSAGIQNPDSMAELDINNSEDMKKLDANLAEKNIDMEYMQLKPDNPKDVALWEQMRKDMLPLMSLLKVDGTVLDAEKLGAVTNVNGSTSSKTKKKMEATLKKQEAVVKKTANIKMDSEVDKLSAQLKAMGYNIDTSGLNTIEKKQQFVDTANKAIQTASIQAPTADGADSSGKPKTVQGELSKTDPLDNKRLRHLYALAGKTYPIKAKTAKQQNVDFLVENGMTKKKAIANQFPAAKTVDHRTKVEKWMDASKKAEELGDTDVVKMYDNLLEKEAYITAGKDKEFLTLLDELDNLTPEQVSGERGKYIKQRLDYLTTKNQYGSGASRSQLGKQKAYELEDLEIGDTFTDLSGVTRTVEQADKDWATQTVYNDKNTAGMKETDTVITSSGANYGTTTDGVYTPPSSTDNSNNYIRVYKGNVKNAQAAVDKDESLVNNLERNADNIAKMRTSVDNGDYQSGLGKKQWNDLMTKMPFDKAQNWTFGEAKEWLERNTDFKGAVLDVLASDVKGAASDKDMQIVSEMLGGGEYNPQALLTVMDRVQENAIDRGEAQLTLNHQKPYYERLQNIKGTTKKPKKSKDYSFKPGQSGKPAPTTTNVGDTYKGQKIIKTGVKDGKKVIQLADGSIVEI